MTTRLLSTYRNVTARPMQRNDWNQPTIDKKFHNSSQTLTDWRPNVWSWTSLPGQSPILLPTFLSIKETWNQSWIRVVVLAISPPSSKSADFLNKVAFFASAPYLLTYWHAGVSGTSLDSVKKYGESTRSCCWWSVSPIRDSSSMPLAAARTICSGTSALTPLMALTVGDRNQQTLTDGLSLWSRVSDWRVQPGTFFPSGSTFFFLEISQLALHLIGVLVGEGISCWTSTWFVSQFVCICFWFVCICLWFLCSQHSFLYFHFKECRMLLLSPRNVH